jgi:putative transposase
MPRLHRAHDGNEDHKAKTGWRFLRRVRRLRAVSQRIKKIATTRVRYGFERIQVLLRREGWRDNHIRTYRIYKEEGAPRPRRNARALLRLV